MYFNLIILEFSNYSWLYSYWILIEEIVWKYMYIYQLVCYFGISMCILVQFCLWSWLWKEKFKNFSYMYMYIQLSCLLITKYFFLMIPMILCCKKNTSIMWQFISTHSQWCVLSLLTSRHYIIHTPLYINNKHVKIFVYLWIVEIKTVTEVWNRTWWWTLPPSCFPRIKTVLQSDKALMLCLWDKTLMLQTLNDIWINSLSCNCVLWWKCSLCMHTVLA